MINWLQALKCRIVGHMLPAMDDAMIKHTFDGKGCTFQLRCCGKTYSAFCPFTHCFYCEQCCEKKIISNWHPICICKYQLSCLGFSELPWLVRQFGIATVEEAMRTSRDQKLIDAADDIEKIMLLL